MSVRRAQRLVIDQDGLASIATWIASPNCDDRPRATTISLIVVHGISLPPGEFGDDHVVRLFTNTLDSTAHPYFATVADRRVSAHFFLRRDRNLVQFVACTQRAWHAGASAWRGRAQCNDFSIGIELEGADDVPYTATQYHALARLIRALRRRYPIEAIVGHSEIAPDRKTDPGSAFDWSRLTRSIVGLRGPV